MQVILMKPVRRLGNIGDIISVANGHGRNYLIPQQFAVRATAENLAYFEVKKQEIEAKNLNFKKHAQELAKEINGKVYNFFAQSSSDGRLFGSVSTKDIAKKISEMSNDCISYSQVNLNHPIKVNGVYEVEVLPHPETSATVKIVVAKSENEAQALLSDYENHGSEGKEDKEETTEVSE